MQALPGHIQKQIQYLVGAGRPEEAIALCTAAMESHGGLAHLLLDCRAALEWKAGDRQSAIRDMKAAIAAAPEWAGHQYQYMLWCVDLKQFSEAEIVARNLVALEVRKNSVAFLDSARFVLSFSLLQLRRWQEALDTIRSVKDEKPIWIASRLLTKSDITEAAASKSCP